MNHLSTLLATFCILLSGCAITAGERGLINIELEVASCKEGREWLEKKITKAKSPPSFNAEIVSNEFALFGIASENAYANEEGTSTEGEKKVKIQMQRSGTRWNFLVDQYDPDWKFQKPRRMRAGGLSYDLYYKNPSGTGMMFVMVAWRGVDFTEPADWWFGGLAWISSLLPGPDQYQTARREFQKIRIDARAIAGTRPIYYYVTGHSLGGGLARHIAAGYPCASAVVFDTSPVTLEYRFKPKIESGLVVDINERHDELRFLTDWFAVFSRERNYVHYAFNPVSTGAMQHSITRLAAAMPRIVLACVQSAVCEIGTDDAGIVKARNVYCSGYGKADGKVDPVCRGYSE